MTGPKLPPTVLGEHRCACGWRWQVVRAVGRRSVVVWVLGSDNCPLLRPVYCWPESAAVARACYLQRTHEATCVMVRAELLTGEE